MDTNLKDTKIGDTLANEGKFVNKKILGIIRNMEKVNSKSGLLGNLVKKDRIEFTKEIVEKVYDFLPSEQKYITDEAGNILELDPIGVVRTTLEIMDYQLDPTWYAWGTKAPSVVEGRIDPKTELIDGIADILHVSVPKLSQIFYTDRTHLDKLIRDISLGIDEFTIQVLDLMQKITNLKTNDIDIKSTDLQNQIEQALGLCDAFVLKYLEDNVKPTQISRKLSTNQFGLATFSVLRVIYSKLRGRTISFNELAMELKISWHTMNNWIKNGIPTNQLEFFYNLQEQETFAEMLTSKELHAIRNLIDFHNPYFKNYYLKYERALARNILNPEIIKDYPSIWSKTIQKKQREIDVKFTVGLNILTGEQLSQYFQESGELHHWETTNPEINKEDCQLSATILLDKSNHGRITRRTARNNKYLQEWQQYYEDKSLYCIISLMKGKIPKNWINIPINVRNSIKNGDNIKGILYLYLRNNKIANAYNDPNFLNNIEQKYTFHSTTGTSVFSDDAFLNWLNAGKP